MSDTPSLFDEKDEPEPRINTPRSPYPVDQAQRDRAIEVSRRVLVQAPAGSGKTDLLTRRYLALLADGNIEGPEQILAITFTRAATAEMRARILTDLRAAANTQPEADEDARLALARRALTKARERGWPLLEQPSLLQIETIDSLCMRIAHGQPLLARLGGQLSPIDNAEALYLEAARRTIRHLGGDNSELSNAIAHLLSLRDTNLGDCEGLIANMLCERDRWEEHFPLSGEVDWEDVRFRLEQPFREVVQRALRRAHGHLAREVVIARELMEVANYALRNRQDDALALLSGLEDLPPVNSLEHWQCFCTFLLTQAGEWRKAFNAKEGIPPASKGAEAKQWKARVEKLLENCRNQPGLLEALQQIRALPRPSYDDAQWETLRHLFIALRHALAELRVIFAESNQVDFLEISRAALTVLHETESGLRWSEQLRHVLVDEFQDTSRRQHELLTALLEAWLPGDGRTFFLVGDPMQSIYLFRQAEVELFERVRALGLREELTAEMLELRVNFRSHARLTDPLNDVFVPVFAAATGAQGARVSFTASAAAQEQVETVYDPPLQVHAQLYRKVEGTERTPTLPQQEAETVASIIEQHSERIDAARKSGDEYRVAVLVRNRTHLAAILPTLRRRGIPFRAVEIEQLAERQEMLDLMALVRALVHPMDRIAWLAVLRAPWCGLTLSELHTLTGGEDSDSRGLPMLELIERNLPRLENEAQARVQRTVDVLRRAIEVRMRPSIVSSFSAWIERTWRGLGGPVGLQAVERENAEVFFALLDKVAPDGAELLTGEFAEQLRHLYAQPDPTVSERCGVQIMTIYKAKGLGFDVVIVPGLERSSGRDEPPLVASFQRPSPDTGQEEFFVAPIGVKGSGTKHPLYEWVRRQIKQRFTEERKRLFYVACTRARQELHLIGTAAYGDKGVHTPRHGSLLATAWPALQEVFAAKIPVDVQTPAQAAEVIEFPAARMVPTQPGLIAELAANVEALPGTPLRRLPLDMALTSPQKDVAVGRRNPRTAEAVEPAFRRPEGSRLARAVGNVLHALLQRLGSEITSGSISPARLQRQTELLLRDYALDLRQAQEATREVLRMLEVCAADAEAKWILAEHPGAQSEPSWTGSTPDGVLRTLRADRIFYAGAQPMDAGDGCLWVVDYKTSVPHANESREQFLARERVIYEPQLRAYAHVLRAARGEAMPLRLGLYYPRIESGKRLDWWELDAQRDTSVAHVDHE